MNEYKVSDYGIFTNAISTAKNLNAKIDEGKTSVSQCKNVIGNDSVFMGPAADSCRDALNSSSTKLEGLTTNFTTIASFLEQTSSTYQAGDQAAAQNVLNIGGSAGTANTNNPNRDQIYNYLSSKGYNKAAIIGILANIRAESSYKTDALGDGGTSYGICQWHNSRWDQLKSYCSQNGKDSTTMEGQLDFLMYELENKYPQLNQTLKSVSNDPSGAYQAAYEWTVKFERPASMEAGGAKRGNYAQSELWNEYANV